MGQEEERDRWNKVSGAGLAAALILGAVIGILTSDIFNGVYTFLIVTGAFFALTFYMRDESRVTGGVSTADGAIMGGILLMGVGICGFVYYLTSSVTFTAVGIIAVMLVAASVMIVRNRRYLRGHVPRRQGRSDASDDKYEDDRS